MSATSAKAEETHRIRYSYSSPEATDSKLIRTVLLAGLGDHDRAILGGVFSQRGADLKSVYEIPAAKPLARVH